MPVHHREVSLRVNHQEHTLFVPTADTLLDTLRTTLGLTGAKPGCENGDCGACTVLVDESPHKSCIMLTQEADGTEVTTVEGLSGTVVQQAFLRHFAFQCGYCTPGFLMNAHALVNQVSIEDGLDAFEVAMQEWLESNICRCTSYEEIGLAVREAAILTRDERRRSNQAQSRAAHLAQDPP